MGRAWNSLALQEGMSPLRLTVLGNLSNRAKHLHHMDWKCNDIANVTTTTIEINTFLLISTPLRT
jgi:hypothetical protein